MQKLGDKLKFGSWIEFAQRLDKFLKIKPGSGFLCKYKTFKQKFTYLNKNRP